MLLCTGCSFVIHDKVNRPPIISCTLKPRPKSELTYNSVVNDPINSVEMFFNCDF